MIHNDYTCEGGDSFPSFQIFNIPANGKYLIVIVEDPDAPMNRPFVHLLAVDIPINS